MKRFILASIRLALVLFLLLSVGCSPEVAVDPPVSGTVTLLTRSVTETAAAHRLLVFGASGENACKLNYSFTSGNAVVLSNGRYRFVTLTEATCFDLPAAGEVAGLNYDQLLALKADATLEAVQISHPKDITLPTASYTAILQPATCLLRLTVKDAPDGLTLALKNMPAGLSLSGSYTSATTKAYPLEVDDNICLPTDGNAVLEYKSTSGLGTLNLGMTFEPGYTYSASLQWQENGLKITSVVANWDDGGDSAGDAE